MDAFIVHPESAKVIRLVNSHEEALEMVAGTSCVAYPMSQEFVARYREQIEALKAKANGRHEPARGKE